MKRLFYLCILSLWVISSSVIAKVPVHVLASSQTSIAPMLKKAMPAVVNIVNQGELPLPNDPFLRHIIMEQQNQKHLPTDNHFVAGGSGVIIDAKKGLIITNAHVVDLAKKITVTLSDGRRFIAKKIGSDNTTDIALIQIKADQLTDLPLADSNQLTVGDFVAAIGNPFGLQQTVTSGIVSALHRSNLGIEGLENFIQTDAPINMGNSGGALVTIDGQLVGMNTALISSNGGNIGIGFAIPSNMIKSVVAQLLKFGKVRRGLMGVLVQTLTPDLADAFQVTNQKGAVITQVLPFSPASEAGLKVGDIITEVNNNPVTSSDDIHNYIGLLRIDESVNLAVIRDNKKVTISVKTGDAKITAINAQLEDPYLYGIKMREITEELPEHGYVQGIKVIAVEPYSAAEAAGLQPDDIIVSVNHEKISTIAQLKKYTKPNKNGLLLNILRGPGAGFIVIK